MTRQVIYRYLGTNGVLETPIHLEDIYYVRLIRLRAEAGKFLTNGTLKKTMVTVPEDEEFNWYEVDVRKDESV